MDELKIIFWIVIGLVYLFARRKKPQEEPPKRRSPVSTTEQDVSEPTKPMSFEELLREIQGVKKEVPVKTVDRPPVKRDQEYSESSEGEKQLEDTQYNYRDHDRIYDIYEEATKQAFVRPSLEETSSLDDTIVRFKEFKAYDTQNKRNLAEEFYQDLKNPKGFKKAFIMSEILKRPF